MTLRELYREGCRELASAGVPDAENDAWLLLNHVFSISRAVFYLKAAEEAGEEETKKYRKLILERAGRKPLQQITGEQEFMGLSFLVTEDVLIPRQDSETLVEEVLKDWQDPAGTEPMSVLDLCTGSGCLGLSVGFFWEKAGRPWHLLCTDLSEKALQVALQNRDRVLPEACRERVSFAQGDLFEALREHFDVIVSNPPYIPTSEVEHLMPEVKDFEPRMALDGEADGLAFYRRIAKEAPDYLKKSGRIYLEIGYDQGEAVSALLAENGFTDIAVIRDLAGNDRVVKGRFSEEEKKDV
ncbi:MAG: peptide chain release factor N(5)-glutamine methyltransferase [Lachnospiraceae bacterium]|nr:peptide chain release factor N(5)-glutamine methyltransferase [Lachnospiraceae bacterium]